MIDPEVLKVIDQSIEKWKHIVLNGPMWCEKRCPLCDRFDYKCWAFSWKNESEFERCPIFEKTGLEYCRQTPFYETTLWNQAWLISENYSRYAVKDNLMLSLLYEVRLDYINGKL